MWYIDLVGTLSSLVYGWNVYKIVNKKQFEKKDISLVAFANTCMSIYSIYYKLYAIVIQYCVLTAYTSYSIFEKPIKRLEASFKLYNVPDLKEESTETTESEITTKEINDQNHDDLQEISLEPPKETSTDESKEKVSLETPDQSSKN